MNKDIFLRNANYRIMANNWEDKKDEIIEKVIQDFMSYEVVGNIYENPELLEVEE